MDITKYAIERQIAIKELIENGKKLRQDFLDKDTWMELMKEYGIRKPAAYLSPTKKHMRKYLRTLGIKEKEWNEVCGFESLECFNQRNPCWPLWAWVGLVLEYKADKELLLETTKARTNNEIYS